MINNSSSLKPQLKPTIKRWKPTSKIMMIKWWITQNTSNKCLHYPSHQWCIRLTLRNPPQPIIIHQIPRTLPLCSCITGGLHHWTVDTLQKLVACGISNMISAHKNYMNYSSRHNLKETLICISRTYTTTSRCISMQWIDSYNNLFLVTISSKDALSLKNTSSQIFITLPILGMFRYVIPFYNHC